MQSFERTATTTRLMGSVGIISVGILVAVVSIYLLINPGGLPTYFYIGYAVRFVPVLFLMVVALVWPLLPLLLALVVMFGGEALTDLMRPLFPISPFWMLLALTLGAQIARNIHRNKALPWGEGTMLLLLALWAALYELGRPSLSSARLLIPLLAGFSLVVALGSLRTWRQISFVLVAMYLAFALLVWQLLPFLIPSWGSSGSVLRGDQFGGLSSSLRQATSLDWLFNMMALLSVGMAVRQRGRWRVVLMGLFLAFGASSILTFSRGAFLGLGAGVLALLLLERRGSRRSLPWIAVAGALVVAVAYYSGSWANNAGQRGLAREVQTFQAGEPGRLSLLVGGIKAMPQHILLGAGPLSGVGAHSSLLDIWVEYGGIYAITFWLFILVLFRRSYRMAKAPPEGVSGSWGSAIALGLYASFVAAIANALFDPSFFSLSFAVVFWMMRGLEIGIWKSQLIAVPGSGRRTHYGITHHEAGGTQISGHGATSPSQPLT